MRKIWSLVLYFLGVTLIVLTSSKLFVKQSEEFTQTNHMIIFVADATALCIKMLPFLFNQGGIKKCIDYFDDQYFVPKNDEEATITEECVRVCKRNFRAFAFVAILADVWWNIAPIFDNEYNLPLDIWLPYDPKSGPVTFYVTYIFTVTGKLSTY